MVQTTLQSRFLLLAAAAIAGWLPLPISAQSGDEAPGRPTALSNTATHDSSPSRFVD